LFSPFFAPLAANLWPVAPPVPFSPSEDGFTHCQANFPEARPHGYPFFFPLPMSSTRGPLPLYTPNLNPKFPLGPTPSLPQDIIFLSVISARTLGQDVHFSLCKVLLVGLALGSLGFTIPDGFEFARLFSSFFFFFSMPCLSPVQGKSLLFLARQATPFFFWCFFDAMLQSQSAWPRFGCCALFIASQLLPDTFPVSVSKTTFSLLLLGVSVQFFAPPPPHLLTRPQGLFLFLPGLHKEPISSLNSVHFTPPFPPPL